MTNPTTQPHRINRVADLANHATRRPEIWIACPSCPRCGEMLSPRRTKTRTSRIMRALGGRVDEAHVECRACGEKIRLLFEPSEIRL